MASMQYSQRCKIFVFPKELLKEEWLSTINFHVVKRENTNIELIGFVVLKLVGSAGYEISCIPEPLKVNKSNQRGHKAFKLVREKNCIFEKLVDISEIATQKPVQASTSGNGDRSNKKSSMFDDIVNSEEKPKKFRKGPINKLSRLMGGGAAPVPRVYKSPS